MNLNFDLLYSLFKRIVSAYENDEIYISIKCNVDLSCYVNIADKYDYVHVAFDSDDNIDICLKHFLLGKCNDKLVKHSIFSLVNDPFYVNKLYHSQFQKRATGFIDKIMDSSTTKQLKLIKSINSLEELAITLDLIGI